MAALPCLRGCAPVFGVSLRRSSRRSAEVQGHALHPRRCSASALNIRGPTDATWLDDLHRQLSVHQRLRPGVISISCCRWRDHAAFRILHIHQAGITYLARS